MMPVLFLLGAVALVPLFMIPIIRSGIDHTKREKRTTLQEDLARLSEAMKSMTEAFARLASAATLIGAAFDRRNEADDEQTWKLSRR